MPVKLDPATFKLKQAFVKKLGEDFDLWRPHFQEIAKYLLPRKYEWLVRQGNSITQPAMKVPPTNKYILDATGTIAARTLAHGLMNGITSPSRPWFRLRLYEFPEDNDSYPREYIVWLEEAKRRMEIILSESNYYSSQGVIYLELCSFGTGAMLLYDDFEDVIRFYNSPMGEYRLFQDDRRIIVGMAREFQMEVQQVVGQFGIQNVSERTRMKYSVGGSGLLETVSITHLIEPNTQGDASSILNVFSHREFYWEDGNAAPGELLELKGYRESPIIAPRWDLQGNSTYGTSPTMDALPDIKQLQKETLQKAQSMDKMIRPPVVADVMLRAQPDALLPGGVSFVPGSSFGAKAIYTVNPPVGEMTQGVRALQLRIKEIYYNNLFRNISELETVRSAAEVYERKSEDMLILGGVLERFHSEDLDLVIRRTFNIMLRRGNFPDPPPGLDTNTIQIQYVSVLADAQRAANTGSIERFMQLIGELSAIAPNVARIPDFNELVRDYASRLNIPAKNLRSRADVAAELEAEKEQIEAQQAALVGKDLTDAARNLSQADVGGGRNALQELIGG